MFTNASCTVYNHYRNDAANRIEVYRTYLHAVFWEPRKAANITQSGVKEADAFRVFIPLSVSAEGKTYIDPIGYADLPPDQIGAHWTLTEGVDCLVKGDAPAVNSVKDLKEILPRFYEHFKIMAVDPKHYGGKSMHHWEVSGK